MEYMQYPSLFLYFIETVMNILSKNRKIVYKYVKIVQNVSQKVHRLFTTISVKFTYHKTFGKQNTGGI